MSAHPPHSLRQWPQFSPVTMAPMPNRPNGSLTMSTPRTRLRRADRIGPSTGRNRNGPSGTPHSCQRHAEIGVVVRIAPAGGGVENAQSPPAVVLMRKRIVRVAGAAGLALQHVVARACTGESRGWSASVVDRVAHRPGQGVRGTPARPDAASPSSRAVLTA